MPLHPNVLILLALTIPYTALWKLNTFDELDDFNYIRCHYRCIDDIPGEDECYALFANFMTCTSYVTALNFHYADGRLMHDASFKCGRVEYGGNVTHNTTKIQSNMCFTFQTKMYQEVVLYMWETLTMISVRESDASTPELNVWFVTQIFVIYYLMMIMTNTEDTRRGTEKEEEGGIKAVQWEIT